MKGNQLILVAFFNFKNKTMEIFNVQIFGIDKEQWMAMPVEYKVEWIRKYTNQQDDAIIEDFINNPKISNDKICLTCGVDKHKDEVKTEVTESNIIMDSVVKDFTEVKIVKKSRKK